jgi:hypothetical protein
MRLLPALILGLPLMAWLEKENKGRQIGWE